MYYELSKADKKIARRCIDKGVDAEFREGLEKFDAIIRHWRAGKFAGTGKPTMRYLMPCMRKIKRSPGVTTA